MKMIAIEISSTEHNLVTATALLNYPVEKQQQRDLFADLLFNSFDFAQSLQNSGQKHFTIRVTLL